MRSMAHGVVTKAHGWRETDQRSLRHVLEPVHDLAIPVEESIPVFEECASVGLVGRKLRGL